MAPLSRGLIVLIILIFFNSKYILINGSESSSSAVEDEYRYCLRPCVTGSEPRKCRYVFSVGELPSFNSVCHNSHGNNTNLQPNCNEDLYSGNRILGINGMSPGPQIEICLGDTLEIVLKNGLQSSEISFHWHGFRQNGSVHMDGVPMITQCPIFPFSNFRYNMKPENSGSYFYYAQSAPQQADGIYGALIIREPGDDPSLEMTLLISTRLKLPLTQFWSEISTPTDILVNGKKNEYRLIVNENRRYLMRIINANAMACPVLFSIASHDFLPVAIDGEKIQKHVSASHVVLFPGERFDLILKTNQQQQSSSSSSSGKYEMKIEGLGDCKNLVHKGLLQYEEYLTNSNSELNIIESNNIHLSNNDLISLEKGYDCKKISKNIICALDTNGQMDKSEINKLADESFHLSYDLNTFNDIDDDLTDFRYNIYGFTHYPTYLSMSEGETKVAQINGITFKYPTSPILSQPENTPDEILCSIEKRSEFCIENTEKFCECLQILELPVNKTIELIIVDEGFGGNSSHTFHVHGYQVNVVGFYSFEKPISKAEIIALDAEKKLPRNLLNPIKKDTFTIPNKGYIIVRFRSDNLGYWLWEARSTGVFGMRSNPGMQFLVQVGSRENMPTVPIDFPSCGNNKKPDMVFELN